jgi:hypothetical protein
MEMWDFATDYTDYTDLHGLYLEEMFAWLSK